MSHIGTTNLFWTGTALWVGLWAIFVIRLAWLSARLRAQLTEHHPHRWRRLSWSRRLTWSVWFVFQSREDFGDLSIDARRREMFTVFFDMLLVLAAMIVWFVVSAGMCPPGP